MRYIYSCLFVLMLAIRCLSQTNNSEWRVLPIERLPPDKRPYFYNLLCSSSGSMILTSSHGLINYQGFRINFPAMALMAGKKITIEKIQNPHTEDSIRSFCRGDGNNLFFLSATGRIYYMNENSISLSGWSYPPLHIPVNTKNKITSIWADKEDNLFVGVNSDSLIVFTAAARHSPLEGVINHDGNFISNEITKNQKKIFISGSTYIFLLVSDTNNTADIIVAADNGLSRLNKKTWKAEPLGERWSKKITITGIDIKANGDIWFSTIENGMGFYKAADNKYYFSPDNQKTSYGTFSINSFCKKSSNEYFVAIADSLPAIFNISSQTFSFISDTIFKRTKSNTTDIKLDGFGNLFAIIGGQLFYTRAFSFVGNFSEITLDSSAYTPFIYDLQINSRPYYEVIMGIEPLPGLKEIKLNHNQNRLEFSYSLKEFWNQRNTEMAWKIDGLNMDWVSLPQDPTDKFKAKFIPPLQPGKYVLRVRAKVGNETWRNHEALLTVIIKPPLWQTWWFWLSAAILVIAIIFLIIRWRVITISKRERLKARYEKEAVELEAKALRAQMNPHFVFNSLNSIKSLINNNENEKATGYLITFSKLIRTLFQNTDKREVSLFEELATCRLYTQLEKMRFGDKVEFIFDVDEKIDLKDIKVPALILQPFIENAIWHGLMPKDSGGKVIISVKEKDGAVECTIDDDGIGRELSKKYKAEHEPTHQSKGIGLTQSRLELDKLMNEREDTISITDKKDELGNSIGTKVILTFKENRF